MSTADTDTREAYESPVLVTYGSFEEITAGGGPNGNRLDSTFVSGTTTDQLTFS